MKFKENILKLSMILFIIALSLTAFGLLIPSTLLCGLGGLLHLISSILLFTLLKGENEYE